MLSYSLNKSTGQLLADDLVSAKNGRFEGHISSGLDAFP